MVKSENRRHGHPRFRSLLVVLIVVVVFLPGAQGAVYGIERLGASAGGRMDSSWALRRAWDLACRSPRPATVYVPPGKFHVSKTVFRGPCRRPVAFKIDGVLMASSYYGDVPDKTHEQWIVFEGIDGLAIYGGIIDGRGTALWACKGASRMCPAGTTSLTFSNSKNVLVVGLKSMNSKLYHIVIQRCQAVRVKGVRIVAPDSSPNTDGIHVQMSTGVTITGAVIRTGDDCVSVGPGTSALWIENVACGPGHGISIGSLGKEYEEEGVENVTVRGVVFTGTQNGLRIKSWGRPSRGYVRGVTFEHARMRDVENPIIIDQNYCPHHVNCPHQTSGVRISEVRFYDIEGSSATRVAVNFDCSPSSPCRDIGLENIKLTYRDRPAQSFCKHVLGSALGWMVPPSCL